MFSWWVAQSRRTLIELSLSFMFVLRFHGPVNPVGSCRARSLYLTTLLLGRLSPLVFRQKLTNAFLNQRKGIVYHLYICLRIFWRVQHFKLTESRISSRTTQLLTIFSYLNKSISLLVGVSKTTVFSSMSGKQCRPWSGAVYTVCACLAAWIIRVIGVNMPQT